MPRFQYAETHFSAAHVDADNVMHGHTWRVRATWPDDGRDVRPKAGALKTAVAMLDHTVLCPDLSLAEDIAEHLGESLGAVSVKVWRDAEGVGALWTA